MTRDHSQTYTKPADPYAAHRCPCGHLVYTDDQPGDRCRWAFVGKGCDCVDHSAPAAPVAGPDGAA